MVWAYFQCCAPPHNPRTSERRVKITAAIGAQDARQERLNRRRLMHGYFSEGDVPVRANRNPGSHLGTLFAPVPAANLGNQVMASQVKVERCDRDVALTKTQDVRFRTGEVIRGIIR